MLLSFILIQKDIKDYNNKHGEMHLVHHWMRQVLDTNCKYKTHTKAKPKNVNTPMKLMMYNVERHIIVKHDKRLKCYSCKKSTNWKCSTCRIDDYLFGFCSPHLRVCFAHFYNLYSLQT